MAIFGRRGLKRNRSRRSTKSGRSSRTGGTRESFRKGTSLLGTFLLAFIRLLQLMAAVVVIGYYADNVAKSHGHKPVKYNGTSFLYAVVVGALAAVTALFFMIISFFGQFFAVSVMFAWEWCLVILWAAVTGVMGEKYFKKKPDVAPDWTNMRIAAGFDCASLILWFITAVLGTIEFFMVRKGMRRARSNV